MVHVQFFYYTYYAYEQVSFLPDFISAPIESLAITGGKYQKVTNKRNSEFYLKNIIKKTYSSASSGVLKVT